MHWILDLNPLFASVRDMPPGTTVIPGGAANGRDQWMGAVTGELSGAFADPDGNRYFFDLPYEGPSLHPYQNDGPEAMFFPGDVCRFYIEAEDDQGHVSTLPADVSGWSSGHGYSRDFLVRALPSLADDGQGGVNQPGILLINDDGQFGSEEVYVHALRQLGLLEGEHVDVFAVRAPNRGLSNGIGSPRRGANTAQLAGYRSIFYMAGSHPRGLLSDGSDQGHNDKGDDLGVLTDWHHLAGDRNMAHFGDDIASGIVAGGLAGAAYVQDLLGVQVVSHSVRSLIDEQSAPVILPVAPGFDLEVVAYGGCARGPASGPDVLPTLYPQDPIHQFLDFDAVQPLAPAVTGHGFEMLTSPGVTYAGVSASIVHDRMLGIDRKVDLTFPFDLSSVYPVMNKAGESPAAELVAEILAYFDAGHVGGNPASANLSSDPGIGGLRVEPNPFNPATSILFHVGTRGRYAVRIYNVRGERVATLHDGALEAGPQELRWNGRDENAAPVATGMYVARIEGEGFRRAIKMALIR
jgi:hypothetical protein